MMKLMRLSLMIIIEGMRLNKAGTVKTQFLTGWELGKKFIVIKAAHYLYLLPHFGSQTCWLQHLYIFTKTQ